MRRTERPRPRRLTGLAGILLLAAGCAGPAAGTSTTGAEATTTVAAPLTSSTTSSTPPGTFTGIDGVATDVSDASRIVALTGDITEIIFELGMGDNVVAVDITTTYPPEADRLKSEGGTVGFGQALGAEAVLKHRPTLVIGDETVQPTETIDQLREAGIPVAILEYRTTLEGVGEKIRQIGTILGVADEGEALAAIVMGEIAAARTRAPSTAAAPRVMYLYTRGPSLIFVFGSGLPTNAMIEGAGAVDVGAELGEGPIPLTPEALVAAAPDVIVAPESGVEGLGGFEALLDIPGVSETPAGRNRAFLAYDEAFFFNLGPRAGQALDRFVTDLYALTGQ